MKKIVYTILSFSPVLALAQTFNVTYFQQILAFIRDLVKQLVPILFGVAIVYFFWGVAKYVRNAGDAKKEAEARGIITWGVIGIVVMASLWGIVIFLQNIIGVGNPATINVPTTIPGL